MSFLGGLERTVQGVRDVMLSLIDEDDRRPASYCGVTSRSSVCYVGNALCVKGHVHDYPYCTMSLLASITQCRALLTWMVLIRTSR